MVADPLWVKTGNNIFGLACIGFNQQISKASFFQMFERFFSKKKRVKLSPCFKSRDCLSFLELKWVQSIWPDYWIYYNTT